MAIAIPDHPPPRKASPPARLHHAVAGTAAVHRQASPSPMDRAVTLIARRHRIDPALLASLVQAESGFRVDARSPRGALGLTQVLPSTARALGIEDPERLRADPLLSLDTGARYLKQMQRRFGNDLPLVLASYNAGPGAVARHGAVPPYPETRRYVHRVLAGYQARRQQRNGQRL